eukprot:15022772-Alexandrium_andersonii.AAC.1
MQFRYCRTVSVNSGQFRALSGMFSTFGNVAARMSTGCQFGGHQHTALRKTVHTCSLLQNSAEQ